MILCSPSRINKAGLVVSFTFFLCAAVCFLCGTLEIPYRMLLHILCIIFLTIGIQITTRYVLCDFHYQLDDIMNIDKKNNLTVVKTQGKKRILVCNINLETALGIIPKSEYPNIERDFGKIEHKFNYCENLFPKEPFYYVFEFNEKRAVIIFEPSDDFLNEMKIRMPAVQV